MIEQVKNLEVFPKLLMAVSQGASRDYVDYVLTPCMCVCHIEALKGTLKEWTGGVGCEPESDRIPTCVSG